MKIFVIILISCFVAYLESEESCSGWIYIPKFKRCIRHFCNIRTWYQAKEVCERNNSRLVIPCNREYSDMVATLASLYEYEHGTANAWLGFKAVLGGAKLSEPSNYKAIESGHCTGSALNWAPNEPNHDHIQECVQNYAGSSDTWQLTMDNIECDSKNWFVCEKEGGCDTV